MMNDTTQSIETHLVFYTPIIQRKKKKLDIPGRDFISPSLQNDVLTGTQAKESVQTPPHPAPPPPPTLYLSR